MATKQEVADLIERAVKAGNRKAARELLSIYDSLSADIPRARAQQTLAAEGVGYTPAIDEQAFYTEGPSQPAIDALSPLAGLQERFAAIEDPREAEGIEQLARGVGSGAIGVAKGALLDTGLAAAEAILGREEVERSPSFRLSQELGAIQEGLYKPSVSFDDVLDSPTLENVTSFVGEGIASSIPGMAAAVASMPRYALSMVGDIAKQRAANRGPGAEVNAGDLIAAIGTAGVVAGAERLGGRQVLGRGTAATAPGRIARAAAIEPATEFGQEFAQTVGEQVFTREGDDLVLGVDVGEGVKRGAAGALIGGAMGPLGSAASEGVRAVRRRLEGPLPDPPPPSPQELVAIEDVVQDAPSSQDQAVQAQAIKSEADAAEKARVEAVPARPRTTPAEPRQSRAQRSAEVVQADADIIESIQDPAQSLEDVAVSVAKATGMRSPDGLAARNEDTEAFLEELGYDNDRINKVMRRDPVSYGQAVAQIDSAGMRSTIAEDGLVEVPASVRSIADDIVNKGRLPSEVETLAILHAEIQHKRAYKALLDQVDSAVTDSDREALRQKLNKVEEEADLIARANTLGGSAIGRALRFRRFRVDQDLNVLQSLSKARLKKGSPLSTQESDFIKKTFKKSDATIKRATAKRDAESKKLKRALQILKQQTDAGASPEMIRKAQATVDTLKGRVIQAEASARSAQADKVNASSDAVRGILRRTVSGFADVSRALTSSLDDSALGRQGRELFVRSLFSREQAGLRTIAPALRILSSAVRGKDAIARNRALAQRMQKAMVDRPFQKLADKAGLEITEIEGIGASHGSKIDAREEQFATNLFESKPFLRLLGERIVTPSQNAYGLTLNRLRTWHFDKQVRNLARRKGLPADASVDTLAKQLPLADIKAIAAHINASTGRGRWALKRAGKEGSVDPVSESLRNVMFAPVFTFSRVESALQLPQMLLANVKGPKRDPSGRRLPLMAGALGPFRNISDEARGLLLQDALYNAMWITSLGLITYLGAGEDDADDRVMAFLDPGNADFGKIRYDNHHWDLSGGIAPTLRYMLPYNLGSGDADGIIDAVQPETRMSDKFGRLMRNKLHPTASAAWSAYTNKDYLGRDLTEDEWEDAMDTWEGMMSYIGQRFAAPSASAFLPITAQEVGRSLLGEEDEDDRTALERALPLGAEFFGIGHSYYEPRAGTQSYLAN
jgi:hypothetical protein|tara:strand:- start:846 stop:4412 length:3567 start_codon:yes stop_codon:yes gene_type:complete